jgi:hypothetical protein
VCILVRDKRRVRREGAEKGIDMERRAIEGGEELGGDK